MDKFGIFDVLTKLASNKTATNGIINAVKNVSANLTNNENIAVKKSENSKEPKFSKSAILSVLKKHEELSKQIDAKNKKP
ncbi:MAG: hypothetical protein J6R29_01750 [Clostridia bacterium]|nr:hypothetical protein [Clostridia bacterium]